MATPITDRKPPADRAVSRFPDDRVDAVVVVSFGGPEGPDDVMPFLENVTRGRGVPRERLLEVAEHYQRFGGVSPINEQNRELIAALEAELRAHGIDLPVYFGNRNWRPFLVDTLREMRDDGVRRALAFFTSAFSSYSGCRQYRENLFEAQQAVGPDAPEAPRLRMVYNHPGFVEANVDRVRDALAELEVDPDEVHVAFTAHSIPAAMARNCAYEAQLRETARLVADATGIADFAVAYQSRSGPPQVPWLEPDVNDHLEEVAARGVRAVVVSPIGFVSDHLEVLYDLDVEARATAERLGLRLARAGTAGTHPAFVAAIRELVQERLSSDVPRRALGRFGPSHDTCAPDCCLPGSGRPSPWDA
ncbi:MAG TPA: ferrochelatase [Gaiellaceae bacterium]|jgi:ferrochelatase|nr:ferrochelatase [Gaiellaceae bacterium]